MNRSFRMGVIGFVIGLPFFCYLELKSDTLASAKAGDAASEPTGPGPTAIPQPKKESPAHARRPQQAIAGAASRTPGGKTGIKPQRAKDPAGSDVRPKEAGVARPPNVGKSKGEVRGSDDSDVRAGKRPAQPPGETRRPEATTTEARPRLPNAARKREADQSKSGVRGSNDSEEPAGKRPARQPLKTRGPKVATTDVPPAAANRRCQIRLNRILVGEELVTNGVFEESTLDEQAKHGKYVVYFELSVTSQEQRQNISVSFKDFRLEDGAGLIYAPIGTNDRLSAVLAPGKSARGGVAFAVYNDGAPARLLFRTGEESFTPLPESLFWNRGE
jgi:hypothetical protein